ncbi:hypothetical protein [Sulfurimicrobium lacus]|uniref:hypothetical protein n=1 Tax=Sulfurimicrobium lacus TaxID=2715678 RepID=UPI00156516BC|nr:hypothetical protein [Sulfurimicrobium lacus]
MNSLTFNPRLLLLVMLLTMVIQGWRTNTHIMNGILQDFDTAIYRASSSPSMKDGVPLRTTSAQPMV